MLKKIKERNFHFLLFAFLFGLFIGVNFSFSAKAGESTHKYLDYFHQVYQIISSEYVDGANNKDLFYGAIQGMIKSLNDPFSRFLDEDSYGELNEMTTGKFVGVGVEISIRDGEVVVITPIEDSPAMRAGIKAGDIIFKVNKQVIKDMKIEEIINLIKGLPGSTVKLYVRRDGVDDILSFDVERAPIKLKSVEYGVIKEYNIGYIRIKNFGSDTAKDVNDGIRFFNKSGIDKVIVDLRYNPGGLLTAAVSLSEIFLKKGQVVVSTKGKEGTGNENMFKVENDPIYSGNVIVLVNKGSASASEIFAGAIRDNKRGILVGEKTFGKGSVQKTFNLDKNIGVAVTVAKYYTPAGELIHKKGIMPDFEVPEEKLQKDEIDSLKKIDADKSADAFFKKDMQFNETTRADFKKYIAGKNIKISDRAADIFLKNKIGQYRKKDLYDLEFDNQLSFAAGKFKK